MRPWLKYSLLGGAGVIALICAIPGSNAVRALLGPPALWEYTHPLPPSAAIAGTYRAHLDQYTKNPQDLSIIARVRLSPDGTASFENYPVFDFYSDQIACRITGTGRWFLKEKDSPTNTLDFEITSETQITEVRPIKSVTATDGQTGRLVEEKNPTTCKEQWIGEGALIHRRPPYAIYQTVSDPDSGTGFEWVREQ
jgi:hypothetical protein